MKKPACSRLGVKTPVPADAGVPREREGGRAEALPRLGEREGIQSSGVNGCVGSVANVT